MKKIIIIITITLLFLTLPASAETRWNFEASTGSVYNLPLPLNIDSAEQGEIEIEDALFESNSQGYLPNFNFRLSRYNNQRAWELELIHHKMILNQPSLDEYNEIQKIDFPYGFNHLTINHTWETGVLNYRLGAGVLLTYPDIKIDGTQYPTDSGLNDTGIHAVGPTIQLTANRSFELINSLHFNIEAKITGSYAKIEFEEENLAGEQSEVSLTIPSASLHTLFGLKYSF